MGRKYVLTDDYDGKELPEDTQPVRLSLGRTTYNLYLSEDNHGKLLQTLEPFIKDAETASTAASTARATKSTDADKEKKKAVREWAQAQGLTYKTSTGEEKTLGDRGRIPESIMEAYDAAH